MTFRRLMFGIAAMGVAGCGPVETGGVSGSPEIAENGGAAVTFVAGERVHLMPRREHEEVTSSAAPANSHLTYYGGHVISNVKVYAVFWGPNTNATVKANIGGFYTGMTNSAYMDWLSEYNTNIAANNGAQGTNQTIGRGTFAGNVTITPSVAGNALTDAQIQSEINAQITKGALPAPDANTIYMIDFPPGTSITQGSSKSCVGGGFCAYHGTFTRNGASVYYGVLPDMSPGSGCDTGCGGSPTMFNNQTSVASHELIEAVTDAEVGIAPNLAAPLAWYDSVNGEIGDICNATQGTITGGNGTVYTVQAEWSNVAGACVITRNVNPPPPVSGTLTNPGFEAGNTSGWTVSSGSVTAVGGAHTGNFAAQVGATTAFNGNATIAQSIALPTNSTITLSFWYKPFSNDTIQYDQQQMQVRDPNTGAVLVNVLNVCSGSQTWTHVTQDISAQAGKTVQLWFNTHDDGAGSDPTWYLLDDVSVTSTAKVADTTAPTTSVTAPGAGATVSGTVTVTATATDNVGVTKVELYIDGALLASGAASPESASWDTTKVANGAHQVTSKAYDAAGNVGTSAAVSVTVSNVAPPPNTNLISNGGFEGSLAGWTLGGASTPLDSTVQKHTGNNSLRCGANTQSGAQEFSGDSFAYQTVTIPNTATKATLTFWYFASTTDTIQYDWQDAQVRNAQGATLLNIFHICDNSQVWTQKVIDLTAYKGQTVQVYFNGHGDGSTDPTTLWIDDVSLVTQ